MKVARDGSRKTQIMYEVGLSFAQLTEYLSFLVEFGLVETLERDEKLVYKTTAKGKRYVRGYDEIKRLLQKNSKRGITAPSSPPFSFSERSA